MLRRLIPILILSGLAACSDDSKNPVAPSPVADSAFSAEMPLVEPVNGTAPGLQPMAASQATTFQPETEPSYLRQAAAGSRGCRMTDTRKGGTPPIITKYVCKPGQGFRHHLSGGTASYGSAFRTATDIHYNVADGKLFVQIGTQATKAVYTGAVQITGRTSGTSSETIQVTVDALPAPQVIEVAIGYDRPQSWRVRVRTDTTDGWRTDCARRKDQRTPLKRGVRRADGFWDCYAWSSEIRTTSVGGALYDVQARLGTGPATSETEGANISRWDILVDLVSCPLTQALTVRARRHTSSGPSTTAARRSAGAAKYVARRWTSRTTSVRPRSRRRPARLRPRRSATTRSDGHGMPEYGAARTASTESAT